MNYKYKKNELGYYQCDPLPNEKDLEDFYSNVYFQEGTSTYETEYTSIELDWINNTNILYYNNLKELLKKDAFSLLDLGCGEGWLMKRAYLNKCSVGGIDFSEYGISKFNPDLLPFFKSGSLLRVLEEDFKNKNFNVIALTNVLEHVISPEEFLNRLKPYLSVKNHILMITVPNDESPLHDHLINNKHVKKRWWRKAPEHISYWNKSTFFKMIFNLGYKIEKVIGSNPVDLNLLNPDTNYIENPEKGKNIHFFRCNVDNYINNISREKYKLLCEVYGDIGIGRDLTYFCKLYE